MSDPSVGPWRLGSLLHDRGAPLGRHRPARSLLGASRGSPRRQSRAAEMSTQAQHSRGSGTRPLGHPVGRRRRRSRSTHATHTCARTTAVGEGRDRRAAASSGRCTAHRHPARAPVAPSARPQRPLGRPYGCDGESAGSESVVGEPSVRLGRHGGGVGESKYGFR